jgi:hypothetical protein
MAIDKNISWQFLVYVALLLISAGSCYATLAVRLANVEANIASYRTDHELLIRIDAKMDQVSVDMSELKATIKQHLQKN